MGCEELILPCEPWRAWAWGFLAGGENETETDRQTDGPGPLTTKAPWGYWSPPSFSWWRTCSVWPPCPKELHHPASAPGLVPADAHRPLPPSQ